jgi:hypothetical protein
MMPEEKKPVSKMIELLPSGLEQQAEGNERQKKSTG